MLGSNYLMRLDELFYSVRGLNMIFNSDRLAFCFKMFNYEMSLMLLWVMSSDSSAVK